MPRDGTWGGFKWTIACFTVGCGKTIQTGYFELRSRVVREIGYNVVIGCYNPETRQSYDRYFTVDQSRASARLNDNGVARFSQTKSSDSRSGTVTTTVDFSGARPTLTVVMEVGRFEVCDGRTTFRVKRGERP